MDYFGSLLTIGWWLEPGLVYSCFGSDYTLRSEIVDCFKVLLLDFMITYLIALTFVLIS